MLFSLLIVLIIFANFSGNILFFIFFLGGLVVKETIIFLQKISFTLHYITNNQQKEKRKANHSAPIQKIST